MLSPPGSQVGEGNSKSRPLAGPKLCWEEGRSQAQSPHRSPTCHPAAETKCDWKLSPLGPGISLRTPEGPVGALRSIPQRCAGTLSWRNSLRAKFSPTPRPSTISDPPPLPKRREGQLLIFHHICGAQLPSNFFLRFCYLGRSNSCHRGGDSKI